MVGCFVHDQRHAIIAGTHENERDLVCIGSESRRRQAEQRTELAQSIRVTALLNLRIGSAHGGFEISARETRDTFNGR